MAEGASKSTLRAAMIEARARAAARYGESAPAQLRDNLLAHVPLPASAVVSGFWPMRDEIDLRPVLEALSRRGHVIGLPVVAGRARPLVFRAWRPGDRLEEGDFKTSVPAASAPEVVPSVLLVPLLAFDRHGYRLGYGGGFYDRTLAALRPRGPVLAVGVAYAEQECPAAPRDETDQPVDWIVTERAALRIEPGSAP